MENSTIEIEVLKAQLKELEKENDYLKILLRDSGIDYAPAFQSEGAENISAFVPNQGSRIVPVEITRNHARQFFSYFWGRLDVYSKRYQNKVTGKAGYFPQCDNFWRKGICPKASGAKANDKKETIYELSDLCYHCLVMMVDSQADMSLIIKLNRRK